MKKLITLFLLFLFISPLGHTSGVKYLKPQELVQKATAITIAKVKTTSTKSQKCAVTRKAQLTPTQLLKGRLPKNVELEVTDTFFILVPGCPRVMFIRAPHVQEFKEGQEVIATVDKIKGYSIYKVTSTYDMSELDKIKNWIAK